MANHNYKNVLYRLLQKHFQRLANFLYFIAIIKRQAIVALWCCLLLVAYVGAEEWNCASSTNKGIFTRSTACTISGNNDVSVTGILQISGTNNDMYNLATITAATGKRHFVINDPNAKLILRYIRLVGGDVSANGDNGGSIFVNKVDGAAGEVNIHASIIDNNKAYRGGGIYSWCCQN